MERPAPVVHTTPVVPVLPYNNASSAPADFRFRGMLAFAGLAIFVAFYDSLTLLEVERKSLPVCMSVPPVDFTGGAASIFLTTLPGS